MLNQLVRYEPVLRLVAEIGGGELLDAGSGSVGISRWLGPRWTVTAVDTHFDDYGGARGPAQDEVSRVFADVRELPFGDGAFDVTVALDLVEHVPEADRDRAIGELSRVTRRRLILGCPAGAPAFAADRRLAEYCRRHGLPLPGWLEEHMAIGFPEASDLSRALTPAGDATLVGNENARAHERITRMEVSRLGRRPARALDLVLSPALHERAPRPARVLASRALWLLRGRDRRPTYRTIAVLDYSRSVR